MRHRLAAVIAALVAAASLAAGAHAIQPTSNWTALPVPGCDDEFGCGMNHNEVMAATAA